MKKHFCPRCSSTDLNRTRARGFLQLHLFPLFGLRPFRCPHCGRRFLRFSTQATPGRIEEGTKPTPASQAFLKTEDELTFQQLIRQMSDAERRLEGEGSADGKMGN